jgi:hypothetical protein
MIFLRAEKLQPRSRPKDGGGVPRAVGVVSREFVDSKTGHE